MERVFACRDCGEEVAESVDLCPTCGGPTEQVDPVLVASIRFFEEGFRLGREASDSTD